MAEKNKKPLRNTEVLRRLVEIKEQVKSDKPKEAIMRDVQYLIDNL